MSEHNSINQPSIMQQTPATARCWPLSPDLQLWSRHQNIPDPGPGGDSAGKGWGVWPGTRQAVRAEREREWAETRRRRTGRQPPENGECRHNDNMITQYNTVRRLTNVTRPELIMPVSHHSSVGIFKLYHPSLPPSPSLLTGLAQARQNRKPSHLIT